MKKLLTLIALLGAASMSFGQGHVNFANSTTTRVSTNGTANANAGGPAGSSWYYALLQTAAANTTAPVGGLDPTTTGWTVVALGSNTTLAGTLSGNPNSDGAVVSPSPSTMDYAVAGWSANIGADWASVQAFFGNSPVFTQQSHTNGASATVSGWYGVSTTFANDIAALPTGLPLNGIFGTGSGLINGFGLQNFAAGTVVPEPATFALAGLGAAALVIFRRRRN